jgi:hypothetical protein
MLEAIEQRREAAGVARNLEDQAERTFVDARAVALQAAADDAIPVDVGGGQALGRALPEDFRVVDLADGEAAPAGGPPDTCDPAVRDQFLRSPGEDEQQLAPVVRGDALVDGQLADQPPVQQRGEFPDRGIRTRRLWRVRNRHRIREHGNRHLALRRQAPGRGRDTGQRGPNGGMCARVQ